MRKKFKINEIFYSIQGEGANVGMPAIFVRFSGCNQTCAFCDTDHQPFFEYSEQRIREDVENLQKENNCKNIIWTGGEPTLQLEDNMLFYFVNKGYRNYIETNGTGVVPKLMDYITYSPKEGSIVVLKRVDEVRIPISAGMNLPEIENLPKAKNYFISPIDVSDKNIKYCLELIKRNSRWKLSAQMHKLLNIK
ncbi:MAG: 7-carboxy-7-deazaguanine synthase QueE [Prevotellaceae bacterium]|jgi:organic radical activating enzyme|nr:7-carboxy-7-deazaguanine synthase QueE [Prevotellaceae bacterium]